MANLGELERAIGLSIAYTIFIPTRFDRFASEVERISQKPVDREQLKQQLEDALAQIRNKKGLEDRILDQQDVRHVEEGFGRLDALNRIGNQVFFANMLPRKATKKDASKDLKKVMPDYRLAANFARQDAPVSFPPIWSTPWFSWAQYDASVQNELVRNAGEALGVNAKVNLREYGNAQLPTFRSSVEMLNIHWFERLLAGPHPLDGEKGFKGLLAPKWTDAAKLFPNDSAWKLDDALVTEGARFTEDIASNVIVRRSATRTTRSVWDDAHWVNMGGQRYFNVVHMSVDAIGTDRQQARVLTERRVNLPAALGLRPIAHLNAQGACELPGEEPATTADETLNVPFVLALMAVVDRTIARWFDDHPEYRAMEKRCAARAGTARTGGCSGLYAGPIRKPRGPSFTRCALSRAPARRRVGDGALSAQRLGADLAGHADPATSAAEGLLRRQPAVRSGQGWLGAAGGRRLRCLHALRHRRTRQQQPRPFIRGHRSQTRRSCRTASSVRS